MVDHIKLLNVSDAEQDLPAGSFSEWLESTEKAESVGADVPCGECNACCRSSYFIHIEADETDALDRIPDALLFDAPGMPGHRVMGYNEQGHCPMLIDDRCSIYEHRPRTCRRYDCRVFPAVGIEPGRDKPLVGKQSRRWKFAVPNQEDGELLDAARAAARFLIRPGASFQEGLIPSNATQLAMLSIKLRTLFVGRSGTEPSEREVTEAIQGARR